MKAVRLLIFTTVIAAFPISAGDAVKPPAPSSEAELSVGQLFVHLDSGLAVKDDDPHAQVYETIFEALKKYFPGLTKRQMANMCLRANDALKEKGVKTSNLNLLCQMLSIGPAVKKNNGTFAESITALVVMMADSKK